MSEKKAGRPRTVVAHQHMRHTENSAGALAWLMRRWGYTNATRAVQRALCEMETMLRRQAKRKKDAL